MTEVTCPTCRKQHYIKLYDHGYIAIEEKYCSTECWDKEESK